MDAKTFIVLSLIACCVIIYLTDNLVVAGLIISIMMNIALMFARDEPTEAAPVIDAPTLTPVVETLKPVNTALYGPYYEMWHQQQTAYTDCYEPAKLPIGVSGGEREYDVDTNSVMNGIARARDRKCTDGWASRGADYYKHHFGSELDDTEARVWWGRGEY